ncbi:MAG TPA: glycoside hydrolase family 2 [Rhodanobacteraceae bacterium]|nr:glycoside hydrolase family 2 [Rhodanobacteraceae bacterium]
MIGIAITTLLLFAIVIISLARGGRPDPPALRAAATLLAGPWQFHTGDDPRWAAPDMDATDWQTIDMTALPGSHDGDVGLPGYVGGWMAHGHPGYQGYAWYRRVVTVPVGHASWVILGPTLVEDGYELYWNGQLLGGSGRLGPHPRLVGTRPLLFALPADAAGTRGVLAVRAYMLPGPGRSADGGGMHSAPILAPQPTGAALHRVQWERTIAGYIVDAIEPLAMLALVGLALWCWRRSSHKGFLVFACIALALAAERRLNNAIVSWTDLQDLTTYSWLASVMWVPIMAAWVLAWNRWCLRPWRSIDALAVVLAVVGIIGVFAPSASMTNVCRLGLLALFVVIAARMVRSSPIRGLALITLASIMVELFGSELLDSIGVPGIWFPFGIGVSRTQYIYAIAIPLLAFLIVRTLSSVENATTSDAMMLRQSGAT